MRKLRSGLPTDLDQDKQTVQHSLNRCLDHFASHEFGGSKWLLAIRALEKVGSTCIPLLIDALADNRTQVRRAAARALSRLGPAAFYDIIAALGHEQWMVREVAALLLYGIAQRGGVRITDAVPALANALFDPIPPVRWRAVMTLESLGTEAIAAEPNLILALDDEDDYVREWAAYSLDAIKGCRKVPLSLSDPASDHN